MGTWDWTLADGTLICSEDVAGLFGRLPGSLESTIATYQQLVHPEDREMVDAAIADTLDNSAPYALEHRVLWPDGSLHWLASHARAVRDADGTAVRLTGTVADVTRRKEVEQALEHQALHDGLTGLPNRVLLHDRLQQDLLRTHRSGGSMALLVMDLDRFKEVNDTLGHPAGDTLLRGVSCRLQNAVRASDTVARLGGDEFAVLLPGLDATGAARIATVLRDVLKEPFELDGQAIVLETSIGIAMAPGDGTDPATLLRRADVAMYVAKRSNSGYAVYSAEQDRNDPQHLALIGELRHAVEHDQLVLHYQPKLDCRGGEVIGVEALVRWHHPSRGLILPDQFIPLAEATDLIRPLSLWVLDAALRQAAAWQSAGLELPVAINLSMRTFQDTQLPETIAGLLHRWQVPARRLQVEITESSLMVDPQRALDVLTRLSALGVRVAIDDFGTGYSSLAYLAQLPVQDLKIDRSFVRSLLTDLRSRAIVRSVIELAHSLELGVVGEGVEDEATWSMLTSFGCDQAQGFFMSRALPADELAAWLDARDAAQSSELAA
jgi:diguanylate cyclase (GGDEF)-like protein